MILFLNAIINHHKENGGSYMKRSLVYVLSIALVISLFFNVFLVLKLNRKNGGGSLFDNGTVELTTENYEKYITIDVQTHLQGEYTKSPRGTGFMYKTIDYKLLVQGRTGSYKYEDVSVTVRLIIKANGYTWRSNEPYTQTLDENYTFKILEKGNTEDVVHDVYTFDDFGIDHDGLFTDYEVVSVSGKAIRKNN